MRTAAVLFATFLASTTVQADDQVRLGGVAVGANLDLEVQAQQGFNFGHGMTYDIEEDLAVGAEDGQGLTVSWLHTVGPRLALGLTVGKAKLDLPWTFSSRWTPRFPQAVVDSASAGRFAKAEVLPLLLDLRGRWMVGERVELSAGASAGYVFASLSDRAGKGQVNTFLIQTVVDPELPSDEVDAAVDGGLAYGAVLGLELRLNRAVNPYLEVRFLDADLDFEAVGRTTPLELGPAWVELGLGWRFR
jgi:hypothetical protein